MVCKNVLLHFQPPRGSKCSGCFTARSGPAACFATEQTQEMPPELAPLFERVIPDGQLFRKVEGGQCGS